MSNIVIYIERSTLLFIENNIGYKMSDNEIKVRSAKVKVEHKAQADCLRNMLVRDDHVVFVEEAEE